MTEKRINSDVNSGKKEIEIISEGETVDEACPDINATLCCATMLADFL